MIKVDIAIPIFNEADSLNECLESIIRLKAPKDIILKIYIIDGGSTDNSIEIVNNFIINNDNIVMLHNKKKVAAAAMNMIIKEGDGEYILRLDAGNTYDQDYLINCYSTSIKYNADNVGGVIETIPGSDSYGPKIVQYIMSHPFGVGNSTFRTGSEVEKKVDTVPYGFFKREIFNKVGLFDERLTRAQDFELNTRIISSGGKIWINPKIKAKYYTLTFWKFIKKNIFLEGPFNAYMWYLAPNTFSIRHSITLFFSIGVLGGLFLSPFFSPIFYIYLYILILYFLISIIASFQIALRESNFILIAMLPPSFFIFHFLHGLGVLFGVINIILRSSPVQKK
jgi:glycosyltransferase involved in cell wall biosynthesis